MKIYELLDIPWLIPVMIDFFTLVDPTSPWFIGYVTVSIYRGFIVVDPTSRLVMPSRPGYPTT